jgi:hypothetical protein
MKKLILILFLVSLTGCSTTNQEFLKEYMLKRASNPGLYQSNPLPRTVQCRRIGSYVTCEEI